MSGLYGLVIRIAVLAAGAGVLRISVLGAGRCDHNGVVSVSAQLTVGIAAFVADGLFGAGGSSAGVGGLSQSPPSSARL